MKSRSAILLVLVIVVACARVERSIDPQDTPRLLDGIAADESVTFGPAEEELAVEWTFDDDAEGWRPSADVAEFSSEDGLQMRSTGEDAYVLVEGLELAAADMDRIDIELEIERFVTMPRVYWKTSESPAFHETMSTQFTVPRDGSARLLASIPLAGHPLWRGTITGLRIDPTDVPDTRVRIDSVKAWAEPRVMPRRGEVKVGDEWRRARVAPVGDDWTVAVRVREPAALSLGLAVLPYSMSQGNAALRFRVDTVGEEPRNLLDETLRIEGGGMPAAYRDEFLALEPADLKDGVLTLRFRLEGDPADPRRFGGVWAEPVVMQESPDDSNGERPLNLLVFSLDTLRADHLGCYGYEHATSPNVDRLAASGTRFANASSQAPETLASHMSLMTGRMPSAHGVVGDLNVLADDYETIAETFLANGYHTAAYTEGGYIDGHFGFRAGFQRYHDGSEITPDRPGGDVERTFGRAREWLDRFGKEPFFLFVHTYEIHVPYAPPPEFRTFGPDGYNGPFLNQTIDHHEHIIPINLGALEANDEDRAYIEGLYDGEIAYTDREVGRLLQHLEALGISDRTVVVILSDHGEEFGEHGVFGMHGHSLHEEMMHVPFIVAGPGIPRGRVVSDLVGLYDLYPTIGDLFGFDVPGDLEGRSLEPLLASESGASEGESETDRASNAEARSIISEDGTIYPRISLRKDEWRFIQTMGVERWYVDQLLSLGSLPLVEALLDVRETELYDLEADPEAKVDLILTAPERARTFAERCAELLERAGDIRDRYGADRAGGALDAQQQERLRKLGYATGQSETDEVEAVRKRVEAFRQARSDAKAGGKGSDANAGGKGAEGKPDGADPGGR